MRAEAANAASTTKKVFQNPTSHWEYNGAYFVELVAGAATDHLPSSVIVLNDNTAFIPYGRIKQVMGGIQFYSEEKPFSWGYDFIKAIKNGGGDLI